MKDAVLKAKLKEKYGDSQIYVLPYVEYEHIPDKFTRIDDGPKASVLIDQKAKLVFRRDAEYEPAFQQPIPYILIKHFTENKYYIGKRIKGEERLIGQLSLGFGGHMDPEDGPTNILSNAFARELNEEINIAHSYAELIGYVRDLNSPTNDHIGHVMLLKTEQDISIKENDCLVGEWMAVCDLENNYYKFENWAKHIIDYLVIHSYQF